MLNIGAEEIKTFRVGQNPKTPPSEDTIPHNNIFGIYQDPKPTPQRGGLVRKTLPTPLKKMC